jgi:DNA polymerase-3 subunit alpha
MSYKFPCGCSFPTFSENPLRIDFQPDIEQIPLDCQATWDLISDGNTIGTFQLESRLGQSLARKLQPGNIQELADLVAIMRPGCMESMERGKSITNHYIDRKHMREQVEYLHQSLEPILKNTHGLLVYQEQALAICSQLAGFNLQEADAMRKAIGKKKADEMAKLKSKFIDGCKEVGKVNETEAIEIFGWIEKSQRYSFNASHSLSYALNCYLSAYAKSHFPRVFFTSYLDFAKEKIKPKEEINSLINNARYMNIEVNGPDIRKLNNHFLLQDKQIWFGLGQIKGIGESSIKKLLESSIGIPLDTINWDKFLFKLAPKLS